MVGPEAPPASRDTFDKEAGDSFGALVRDLVRLPWGRPGAAHFAAGYARTEWFSRAALGDIQLAALRRLAWRCLLDVPAYAERAACGGVDLSRAHRLEDFTAWPIQRAGERRRHPLLYRCTDGGEAIHEVHARRVAVVRRAERWAGAPPATLLGAWGHEGVRATRGGDEPARLVASLVTAGPLVVSAPVEGLADLRGWLRSLSASPSASLLRGVIARGLDPSGLLGPLGRQLGVPIFRWLVDDEDGVGLWAAACERGGPPHVLGDHVLVEVVDEGGAARPEGATGRLLLTDLHDHAAPVVRLDLGLRGRLLVEPCGCGRALPRIELAGEGSPTPPEA